MYTYTYLKKWKPTLFPDTKNFFNFIVANLWQIKKTTEYNPFVSTQNPTSHYPVDEPWLQLQQFTF